MFFVFNDSRALVPISLACSLGQMVLLELTDFLWFLTGLLQMFPGVFFERIDRGVNKFGGAVFGIPNWGSRRSVRDFSLPVVLFAPNASAAQRLTTKKNVIVGGPSLPRCHSIM